MYVIVKNHLYLTGTTRPYAYVSLLNIMRSFPAQCFLCDSLDMSLVVLYQLKVLEGSGIHANEISVT